MEKVMTLRRPIEIWISEDEMTELCRYVVLGDQDGSISVTDAAVLAMRAGIPVLHDKVTKRMKARGVDEKLYWNERATRIGFAAADARELPDDYPVPWKGEL